MGWFSKKEEPEEEPPPPPTAVEQAQAAAAALQEQAGHLFSNWMGALEEPPKKVKKTPLFKAPPVVVKKAVVTVKKVPSKTAPKTVPKTAAKPVPKLTPKSIVPKKVSAPKPIKPVSMSPSVVSLNFDIPAPELPPLPPRKRPAGLAVVSTLEELVREIPISKGEEDFLTLERDYIVKAACKHLPLPFTYVREPKTRLHPSVLPRKGITANGDIDQDNPEEQITGLVDADTLFKKSNIDKVIASKEFVDAMKRHKKNTSLLDLRATGGHHSLPVPSMMNNRPLSPVQEPMSTSIPLWPHMHAICQQCGLYKKECICGFGPKTIAPFKPSVPLRKKEVPHDNENTDEGADDIQGIHVQLIPQLRRDASLL